MQSTEPEVLLVDAGNTFVKVGAVEGERVKLVRALPTKEVLKEPEALAELLKGKEVAVASVVPAVSKLIKEASPGALFVEADKELPVKIDYQGQMGADRVANILGAYSLFKSFVVASVGTAVVVDAVVNGEFKGGIILPGLELMAGALSKGTALLPRVKGVRREPGRKTEECIRTGIFRAVEGAIKTVREEFGGLPLILTGGAGEFFSEVLGGIYLRELTLLGISEYWKLKRGRELPQL
jgi:type III pantothenate kinase